ncbi:cupin domain-containing protein [Candidatus Palauibacter sp.]|uniref:cupin domain-containing protein n=1 Tax=Candidatus Palauibacter sp. TaxID=3101350 RepID=UPI003AF2E182
MSHAQTDPAIQGLDATNPLSWILGFDPAHVSFLHSVLGKQVLHCKDIREDRFHGLVSSEVLDTVLGTYGLGPPHIRVVRCDSAVNRSAYEHGGLIDAMKVARLFAEGGTVIFESLHHRHEPLRRLCASFAAQAGARTQTNIYLTPPDSQGFQPHWDTHDVFVLQVEGSKRWQIYDGAEDFPLAGQRSCSEEHEPGVVAGEFTVSAGDVVYIPRGVMHAAESGPETSLHITLGLIAYTWAEFLLECVGELALRSRAWRENLPFGFGTGAETKREVRNELRCRLRDLPDSLDIKSTLVAKLDDIGRAFRPSCSNYLSQAIGAVAALSPDTRIQLRPHLGTRTQVRDGRVVVTAAGRELDFPQVATATVRAVLTGEACTAGAIEDTLDWEGRKVVLATMMREGILMSTEAE